MGQRITVSIDDGDERQPKLTPAAHLMNDDDEEEAGEPMGLADSEEDGEDGDRPAPRKGATVAGGKKGPVPPQFVKAMRARKNKGKSK